MPSIATLKTRLAAAGSNLYVFFDKYNDHCITVMVQQGGTAYTLAKTRLTTAAAAQRYIDSQQANLRAAAARWGVHLTRIEEHAAREARFESRLVAAEAAQRT